MSHQIIIPLEFGEPGDMQRRRWMIQDLAKTAVKASEEGRDQAAVRDLSRAIRLIGMGNPVGSFVCREIQQADQKESVSTSEAWEAYRQQMNDLRQPTLTQGEFEKHLPSAMRNIHGIGKNHNIPRNGKRCRGYCGVILRKVAPTPHTPPELEGYPS